MQAFVIPTIFTAFDKFSVPVQNMGASLNGLNIAAAKSERAFNSLTSSIGTFGALAIVTGFGMAAKAAMDFEKAMTNVATLVDTKKEGMKEMGDAVLKIAQRMPVAISDLTSALYQIRSAGIGAADAMNVLNESAKLGVAGLGTTKDAADMITSAMNVFKRESLGAAVAADVLFKTVSGGKTKVELLAPEFGKAALAASDVGVSFRELMAMTAAMTNTGVQTAEAQTAITQAMISLNKRTTEMIEIQQKLSGRMGITGMEFINFAGGAVGAMKLIDDYATKNRQDLFKIYGRKEGALADIALTRLQYKTYSELFSTMKGGATINDAFAKQAETASFKWEILKNKLQVIGITVGGSILPAFLQISSVIVYLVEKLQGLIVVGAYVTEFFLVWKVGIIALKGAAIAYNFVMGIAAARTGVLLTSALTTTAGINGLNIALKLASITAMGWISILALGIPLIVSLFTGYETTATDLAAVNEKGADGFVKLDKAISGAAASQAAFNDAMKNYNQVQVDIAKRNAMERYYQQTGKEVGWTDFFYLMKHKSDDYIPKPNQTDFMGADSTNASNPNTTQQAVNPVLPNGTQPNAGTLGNQRIELHINNNTGNSIEMDATGAPGIKLSSTTNTWGGSQTA